jgi:hypothetical protein
LFLRCTRRFFDFSGGGPDYLGCRTPATCYRAMHGSVVAAEVGGLAGEK